MPKATQQLESFYFSDRAAWREWLAQNYQTSQGIWLIYYKVKSGKPSIQYSEAVKEALCFGWIDSKVNSLDELRYKQVFTPRKPKSVWSKVNKQYITELIEQGLMTDAGLSKIEVAKQDGSWITLDAIEALVMPADLTAALAANETANRHFAAFSRSTKKNILFWIESAKRAETRLNRIEQTVSLAAQNQKRISW